MWGGYNDLRMATDPASDLDHDAPNRCHRSRRWSGLGHSSIGGSWCTTVSGCQPGRSGTYPEARVLRQNVELSTESTDDVQLSTCRCVGRTWKQSCRCSCFDWMCSLLPIKSSSTRGTTAGRSTESPMWNCRSSPVAAGLPVRIPRRLCLRTVCTSRPRSIATWVMRPLRSCLNPASWLLAVTALLLMSVGLRLIRESGR